MLSLPPSVRIFVATQPEDGRRGVDSLATLVSNAFALDPLSGHLFVFFSRRRPVITDDGPCYQSSLRINADRRAA